MPNSTNVQNPDNQKEELMNEATANQDDRLIEVSDLDSFARILFNWHEAKVQTLEHVLEVPEGISVTYEDEKGVFEDIKLEGDVLKAFRMGVTLSLIELGKLPFTVQFDESAATVN